MSEHKDHSDEQVAKSLCQHCQGHIEFPIAASGMEVACPHCGQQTVLAASVAAAASNVLAPPPLPPAEVGTDTGSVKRKLSVNSLVTICLAFTAIPISAWAIQTRGFEKFFSIAMLATLVVFACANYSWAKKFLLFPFRFVFFTMLGSVFGFGYETAVAAETEYQQSRQGSQQPKSRVFLTVMQAIFVSAMLASIVTLIAPNRSSRNSKSSPSAAPAQPGGAQAEPAK